MSAPPVRYASNGGIELAHQVLGEGPRDVIWIQERVSLLGVSEGGPMSILFAATYPERAEALLLCGAEVKEETTAEWPSTCVT